MLRKTLDYVSHHAIALLALACSLLALAGASYAAIRLPKNSVGTRQLRQGAVTPAKLTAKKFGGYVRAWAHVNPAGKIVGSSPHATIIAWHALGDNSLNGGEIRFSEHFSKSCIALATAESGIPLITPVSASLEPEDTVFVYLTNPVDVYVAVIC